MFAWMKEILDKLLAVVLSLLPLSPFKEFIDKLEDIPFLGYLNYFIPVGTCLKIGAAWLSAIALFYLVLLIKAWI